MKGACLPDRALYMGARMKNNNLQKEIQEYLRENSARKITLREVARHFYISTSHLSHSFKEETGLSPIRYVHMCRIEKAKALLRDTELTVGEVAETVGFNDRTFFSRLFKRMTGLSPYQYREEAEKRV